MSRSEIKILKKQCDVCAKSFKVKVVMPGRYRVKCPHCKNMVRFVVTSEEAPAKRVIAPRLIVPELGHAEKVKDKFYVIKKRGIVGHPYSAICPDCHTAMSIIPDQAHKVLRTKCEKCGTIIAYKAVEPKENAPITQ